ncbi:MaoC-like dehydratase [Sphingobium sp. SYK-6]|uniref:MaoC family dehydratase n=1 Tax=Sphingobium sp. (strain NBRC 103272 / SYK-6) TaxID=627192 RepID=UPI0002277192|nr:MaoC family dehydratase [Sphingobium sp. SYK-6]BAK66392.1 MaoC-like dehydratase [Sphingobium sp. SYK-6]
MSYYWEDLEPGISDSFGPFTVDREEVIAFARRYDPQPFHLDEDAAAQTHFGRLAASGWHTCAMMMAAMVERWQAVPGWQEQSLGAMGIDELRWKRPVFPGDVLRGSSELIEKIASRSRPEMGILKWQTRIVNQHDEDVLSLISIAMQKRRPADG